MRERRKREEEGGKEGDRETEYFCECMEWIINFSKLLTNPKI